MWSSWCRGASSSWAKPTQALCHTGAECSPRGCCWRSVSRPSEPASLYQLDVWRDLFIPICFSFLPVYLPGGTYSDKLSRAMHLQALTTPPPWHVRAQCCLQLRFQHNREKGRDNRGLLNASLQPSKQWKWQSKKPFNGASPSCY